MQHEPGWRIARRLCARIAGLFVRRCVVITQRICTGELPTSALAQAQASACRSRPVCVGEEIVLMGPAVVAEFTARRRGAPAAAPLPHMVAPLGPVFIGIDVDGDRLKITLWRDGRRNAMYAPVGRDTALHRSLPQAIDEAIEFSKALESSVTAASALPDAAEGGRRAA